MSGLLTWRRAEKEDRAALQGFTCTTPPVKHRLRPVRHRVEHLRPWERFVQGKIRSMEPPYSYPLHMIVGEDSQGIAAVSLLEELDGPAQVELCFMALEMRLRHKGGGYADEMADQTFAAIEARALEHGISVINVVGQVDELNVASQQFCRRMKLKHTGMVSDSMQQWSVLHVIAEAPLQP